MTNAQNIKISENDIVASLKPLLDEFFCGKTNVEDNKIIYSAENGQIFQITVSQN